MLLVLCAAALAGATQAAAAPTAQCIVPPSPDRVSCAGWFRADVSVTWTVPEGEVVQSGCEPVLFSADTATGTASCATDVATVTQPIRLDKTPPTVAAGAMREPDASGWYNHPVAITVDGSDETSGATNCPRSVTYGGPDSAAASLAVTCSDAAGNTSEPVTVQLMYDATGPAITAGPERPPDHAGWYTAPVRFDVTGMDSVSGPATFACPPLTYGGPDNASAVLVATCSDTAGNVATRSFQLRFDATPPPVSGLNAVPGDRHVVLRWKPTPDAAFVEVVRVPGRGSSPASVVFTGPGAAFVDEDVQNGVRYTYSVRLTDAAGNQSAGTIVAVPHPPMPDSPSGNQQPSPLIALPGRARLLSPLANAAVKRRHPPLLRWRRVRGARYYNVQIFRGRRKVLSAWPRRPRYQLRRRWTYAGKRHRFKLGRYRWYVWPGLGPRSDSRYGEIVGKRTFRVVR